MRVDLSFMDLEPEYVEECCYNHVSRFCCIWTELISSISCPIISYLIIIERPCTHGEKYTKASEGN